MTSWSQVFLLVPAVDKWLFQDLDLLQVDRKLDWTLTKSGCCLQTNKQTKKKKNLNRSRKHFRQPAEIKTPGPPREAWPPANVAARCQTGAKCGRNDPRVAGWSVDLWHLASALCTPWCVGALLFNHRHARQSNAFWNALWRGFQDMNLMWQHYEINRKCLLVTIHSQCAYNVLYWCHISYMSYTSKLFPGLLIAQINRERERTPSHNQTILQMHNGTLLAALASLLIKHRCLAWDFRGTAYSIRQYVHVNCCVYSLTLLCHKYV